jgi:hypothetical protein
MSVNAPGADPTLSLFAENTAIVRKQFRWQNALTSRLAALLYAQQGRVADSEAIKRCQELMKQHTGLFSSFRGAMALSLAALLSLSPDPQGLFGQTLKVYELLKSTRLRSSDYLAVAAYQIAAQTGPDGPAQAVSRTRAFYDRMKARHFFLTGQDDYIFAAMLGLSDLDVDSGADRIERLHDRLKGEFRGRNSVQALAQVLVLGGSDDQTSGQALALRDALRARKIKLDRPDSLPALGILALLPVAADVVAAEIDGAQAFLRTQKGFGRLWVGTPELLLYATATVAGRYAQSVRDGIVTATLSTSITNLIIAQQTALIASTTAAGSAGATAARST